MNGVESIAKLHTMMNSTSFSTEEADKARGDGEDAAAYDPGKKNGRGGLYPVPECNPHRSNSPSPPLGVHCANFDDETFLRLWRRVEVGLLVVLIVAVWCLLLLPIVFYHLPEDKVRIGSCQRDGLAACPRRYVCGLCALHYTWKDE